MQNETLAQEAKQLLEPIPEEDWITNNFSDGHSKCCAIGHYTRLKSSNINDYSLSNCYDEHEGKLREISLSFIIEKYKIGATIATINNENWVNGYNESTPKQRVLHLLDDMIADGL